MSASVRRVQTGENPDGSPIEDVQFGAEVDGVFVPFVTKTAGYIDALVARGRTEQEAARANEPQASPSTDETPDDSQA